MLRRRQHFHDLILQRGNILKFIDKDILKLFLPPGKRGYSIMTESEKRRQIRQIVRMYSRFASVQEEDLEELTALVGSRKTGAKQKKISIQDITEEDME